MNRTCFLKAEALYNTMVVVVIIFFMLVYQANFQKNKCTKINLRADTKCNPIFLELSANINQTSRFVMISNAG